MEEDFEQWIIDELNGELKEREHGKLEVWLEADERHRAMYEELVRVHQRVKELQRPLRVDVTQKLAEVKAQKRKGRFAGRRLVIAVWATAAMVMLGMGNVWLLGRLKHRDSRVEIAKGQVIMPAEEEAYFILENGERVGLESGLRDTVVVGSEGLEVWVDAEQVLHMQAGSGKDVRMRRLVIPQGSEYRLVLADGSMVRLNSVSRLEFPEVFGTGDRVVRLCGEAYFEVTRDEARPFRVETDRLTVKVLGTKFNVTAYEDEAVATATLVQGAVAVSVEGAEVVRLHPGEQARVNGTEVAVCEVDTNEVVAWTKGRFVFDEVRLEELMRQLERWYDVHYRFETEVVKEIRFSGAVYRSQPLNDLFRRIEATAPVQFKEGETVIISEKKKPGK